MSTTALPRLSGRKNFSIYDSLVLMLLLLALVSMSSFAFAQQMELRENEKYNAAAFEKSKPAVGESAPDMVLKTLEGKEVSLDSYRGKNIVVIKAGYT